jgi:hypothetical protein
MLSSNLYSTFREKVITIMTDGSDERKRNLSKWVLHSFNFEAATLMELAWGVCRRQPLLPPPLRHQLGGFKRDK